MKEGMLFVLALCILFGGAIMEFYHEHELHKLEIRITVLEAKVAMMSAREKKNKEEI